MATITSDPTESSTFTLSSDTWVLSDPLDEGSAVAAGVKTDWSPTTEQVVGVFAPLGRTRKVVVWGDSYGVSGPLSLWALSYEQYTALKTLLLSRTTLLLRSIWGQNFYVGVTGGVTETPLRSAPGPGEPWPLRHAHSLSTNVTEVDAP